MNKKRLLLFLSVSFLFSGFRWMDDDFSKIVMEKLAKYIAVFPQEKAYLHIDKPYYVAGDTLWFRAWLAEAANLQVDSASSVLYVDLVNAKSKKVVALRRVAMSGGSGYGDIALPDSLSNGTYTVRAYTNWMQNFSDDFFFNQDITILSEKDFGYSEKTADNDIDVQFFPEGGHLIMGIDGKVGFKAITTSGLGVDVEGFLVNQKNDTLTGFQSYHLGMGTFSMKPVQGDNYKVLIRQKETGTSFKVYNLPQIESTGYSLRIDNVTSPANIRVFIYNNQPASVAGELTLLAHSQGIPVFSAKSKVERKSVSISIPKSQIPEGITHFTLFNEKNLPVSERLVFLNHNNQLRISIHPKKSSFSPREKTELELMVTDTSGKPVETALSLSVIDAKQIIEKPYSSTIVSHLLLTSDLKGNIEQPAFYFDPANKFAATQLDLLMVTQGWSRFSWKEVLEENAPAPSRSFEQGISVYGRVLKPNKKPLGKTELVAILMTDSTRMFVPAQTDETGKFELHNIRNRDSIGIVIQPIIQKGNGSLQSSDLSVSILPFLEPAVRTTRIPFKMISQTSKALEDYVRLTKEYQDIERKIRASREKLLNEVVVKGRKKEWDTRKIYARSDFTLKPEKGTLTGARTVFDMLQSGIPGVSVAGSWPDVTIQIRGGTSLFQKVNEPLFVLDGVTTSKEIIATVPVNDVESIDVLKGTSAVMYGSDGAGGVIAVYTKRGDSDLSQNEGNSKVKLEKIAGYSIEREFYAPKYDVDRPENNRPDYRSTIFWAPMVKTDKEGKAKISFYNTDAKTTVTIRVEGLTLSGQPGSTKLNYEVR